MQKKIEIVPYNPEWKALFKIDKKLLLEALANNSISIEHVGSTSVPGLAAKPKIDIIVEAHDPVLTIEQLKSLEYQYRGEYNIPLHWGFAKRGNLDVNLHVYPQDHPEIELNKTFRDWLIAHPEDRQAYEILKYQLASDESNSQKSELGLPLYTLKKGAFIKQILSNAGFNRFRMLRCSDNQEWNFYQNLTQSSLINKNDPQQIHLVLYEGTKIIGAAHAQLKNTKILLQSVTFISEELKRKHFEQFENLYNNWIEYKK